MTQHPPSTTIRPHRKAHAEPQRVRNRSVSAIGYDITIVSSARLGDTWGSRTALYTYRGTNDIASAADLLALKPSMDRTRWLLDEATGLVTNKVYADGKGPTYSYTPDGKPLRRVWARGVATDYAYDASGDLANVVYSDNTPSVAYARDRLGRVVRAVVEGVSTNEYAYSLSGLLTNEVQNGVVLLRTYDDFSRATGYEVLGPETENGEPETTQRHAVVYAYDTLGRFASVASGTNVFTYTRLPGTDLVTGYSCGPFRRAVAYEPRRDLIAAVTNTFGDRLISAFDYVNDAAGRRISRRDTRENEVVENVFGYNLRSELTSAQMGTNSYVYAYDPIGNRIYTVENGVRTDYTANELNQYTAVQTAGEEARELAYDEDGNTTFDGRFRYIWDGENRMISVCVNETEQRQIRVQCFYDSSNRRTRKAVIARTDGMEEDIFLSDNALIYDGDKLIRQQPSHDIQTLSSASTYVWGLDCKGTLSRLGGIGGLLQCSEINDYAFLAFYDSHGNVTEIIDHSGDIIHSFEYDPFGVSKERSSSHGFKPSLEFSTHYYDTNTGLVYFGRRYLKTVLGRWINRDRIGESDLFNLYNFAGNDGFNKLDINGDSVDIKLDDSLLGIPNCGVAIYLTHTFNVNKVDVAGSKGCRKAAFISCYSQYKMDNLPDQNNLIDFPRSPGLVGIPPDGTDPSDDPDANGGLGLGKSEFLRYSLSVFQAARDAAQGLCPPDSFSANDSCQSCSEYREKASGSYPEDHWLHFDLDKYNCCDCSTITLKFIVPQPSDDETYTRLVRRANDEWMSTIGMGNKATRTFDCKTKTWSGIVKPSQLFPRVQ